MSIGGFLLCGAELYLSAKVSIQKAQIVFVDCSVHINISDDNGRSLPAVGESIAVPGLDGLPVLIQFPDRKAENKSIVRSKRSKPP